MRLELVCGHDSTNITRCPVPPPRTPWGEEPGMDHGWRIRTVSRTRVGRRRVVRSRPPVTAPRAESCVVTFALVPGNLTSGKKFLQIFFFYFSSLSLSPRTALFFVTVAVFARHFRLEFTWTIIKHSFFVRFLYFFFLFFRFWAGCNFFFFFVADFPQTILHYVNIYNHIIILMYNNNNNNKVHVPQKHKTIQCLENVSSSVLHS